MARGTGLFGDGGGRQREVEDRQMKVIKKQTPLKL